MQLISDCRLFAQFVQFFDFSASPAQSLMSCVASLEKKGFNQIHWSPKGRFLVLAGVRGGCHGALEFWDVNEVALLAAREHFQTTEVEWDPSGRYFTSLVSYWNYQSDNGFCMWDFRGTLLTKQPKTRFKALLWRPRPPTLLTKVQMKV